ncbi:phage tail spike protein [Paenibacillus lautus]|uniref:phage tail spike protein n=1 Tax=Paenibacillus lautus TaxID=1401 RepID=UPI003D2DE145
MLGEIDYDLKPVKPQYFIAKPNREIIGKLSEAYNVSRTNKLNDIDELDLTVPYQLDVNHKLIKNKNINNLKERYLLKVVTARQTDWFIIKEINDNASDSETSKTIRCVSLAHELTDKAIRMYLGESIHARQILNDLTANTTWAPAYIDADFELTYRTFDFPSTNVLDAIFSVAETYNAIVHFDTDKRELSLTKPELTGLNRGLTFSYGKYLNSLGKTIQTDEMVTRLTANGSEGLGIQKVNPTGQNYIENFGYFMYPFQRDAQRNVLSSSHHMSDSLCHALLDHQELVEANSGLFNTHYTERQKLQNQLIQLEGDLDRLKRDEANVTSTMISLQFDGKMFFEKYGHQGSSQRSFVINQTYAYAVMIKVDNTAGVSVSLDGQTRSTTSNQWVLLGKIKDQPSAQIAINGGSTGVFIQLVNISLGEFNTNNNDAAIVDRYSLDHKENQVKLKELEISSITATIQQINNEIDILQTRLTAENNFTPEQLQELDYYVIEREFNDDTYVDEQDLYQAALEKFKELQQPQLSIDIDIVNFLEIVEEQRNWNKLQLGDFVNIKYEPTNTYVTARITEIAFNYENSNINLTLSNAKSVNDESTRIEKFLNDAKNTAVVVDLNKTKWGKAVVDTSEMSKLFDNFWNKVTNDINMASNEFVTIDRKGITIIDPNDPLRFLRATHGVLGLTRSGGLRYETAITADGLIAEMVLGKIILGQRVVIGDTTGVFTIEGSRLMIDDRCGREVVKLGLLSEQPDKFGFYLNRYGSTNCSDTNKVNRVSMTADEGFIIERFRNGNAEKTFGTTLDGDLFIKAGVNDQVFTIDKNGLALGHSIWDNAPFRADYNGNVWMYKLYAEDAKITKSIFKDGHIEGSSLTLRDRSGGVIKMFPEHGLWFGSDEFADAPASISMDGTAKFKKGQFIGPNGDILIDAEAGYIDMDKLDIINVGKLVAETLQVNTILADQSYINDLTVNKVKTLPKDALRGAYVDYIEIEDNFIRFITAKVDDRVPAQDSRGRNLYWQDSEKKILTTEVTAYEAFAYIFKPEDIKVKQEISFAGSGNDAEPTRKVGTGDGGSGDRAKLVETKYKGGFKQEYKASNTGKLRSIDMSDDGIKIISEEKPVTVESKDVTLEVKAGTAKIVHSSGSFIEIAPNGAINIKSTGAMNFEANGNMKFTAPRIDLN